MRGFIKWLGGMIAEPRATLGEACAGTPGGVRDLFLLLGLQLLAVQLPELLRSALSIAEVGYTAGVTRILNTVAQAVILPVLAALGGGLVLGWRAPGARLTSGATRADLAALAALPAVALQIAASLALAVGLLPATRTAARTVLGLCAAWFVALLVVAARRMATTTRGAAPSDGGARRSTARLLAATTVIGLLCALFAQNIAWIARNPDEVLPMRRGNVAPAFQLPSVSGAPVSLGALRGRVVLLSFWATYCAPCVRELHALAPLLEELGPKGLEVLAINTEGDLDLARRFLEENRGVDGAAGSVHRTRFLLDDGQVTARYRVQSLPHLVLVDRRGAVLDVHVGAIPVDQLRSWLLAATR
jgi:thiol-disulfide isomerase/thioredoxin